MMVNRLELEITSLDGSQRRTQSLVNEPRVILGRFSNNQVPLVSDRNARKHARIADRDGRLVLHDLGSTNGVLLEGVRIKSAPIGVGASFVVGGFVIRVVDHVPVIAPTWETDERPFLAALRHTPDDDELRARYASHLEMAGERLRATWLRTELALRRVQSDDERQPLEMELYELSAHLRNAPRWRMLVSRLQIEGCQRTDCASTWNTLVVGVREETDDIVGRECRTCQAGVIYDDAYEESLLPPPLSERRWRIAVDRRLAPRKS